MYGCSQDCLILIPFRLPQISCFTLSLKYFSIDLENCPDVRIGHLLQFPHLLRAGPILLTLLFFPQFLHLTEFCVVYIFFSTGQVLLSTLTSHITDGVLHAHLCLKVYSLCINGERYTPCSPIPPPSFSLSLSLFLKLYNIKEGIGERKENSSHMYIYSTSYCSLEALSISSQLQRQRQLLTSHKPWVSIIYYWVTKQPQYYWLKAKAILFLRILWVWYSALAQWGWITCPLHGVDWYYSAGARESKMGSLMSGAWVLAVDWCYLVLFHVVSFSFHIVCHYQVF